VSGALLAVGMFSMFEASIQDEGEWKVKPFKKLDSFLKNAGQDKLAERFEDYYCAINVLKHGTGSSLKKLLEKGEKLEFKVKSSEAFFEEGDVSEVDILVDADTKFILGCVEIIEAVSLVLRRPGGPRRYI
jgi:hypothetical protein